MLSWRYKCMLGIGPDPSFRVGSGHARLPPPPHFLVCSYPSVNHLSYFSCILLYLSIIKQRKFLLCTQMVFMAKASFQALRVRRLQYEIRKFCTARRRTRKLRTASDECANFVLQATNAQISYCEATNAQISYCKATNARKVWE